MRTHNGSKVYKAHLPSDFVMSNCKIADCKEKPTIGFYTNEYEPVYFWWCCDNRTHYPSEVR